MIENTGSEIPTGTALVDYQLSLVNLTRAGTTPDEIATAEDAAKELLMATALVQGATMRYDRMRTKLANDYAKGDAQSYPKTLDSAYSLLTSWTDDKSAAAARTTGSAIAFTTVGAEDDEDEYEEEGTALVLDRMSGGDSDDEDHGGTKSTGKARAANRKDKNKSHIQCFHGQEHGHYKSKCPKLKY
jgi:hypothetical protein